MEFASRVRWILVVAVGVLAIGLIIWGLLSIASGIFNTSESEEIAEVNQEPIYDVRLSGKVRYTIDGPVVANENHRSAVVEVAPSIVTMTVYKSYGQQVVSQNTYPNTNAAYQTFLDALHQLNVNDRLQGTTESDDNAESGVCPQGRRFILEVDSELRRWTTSCSSDDGNAGFSMSELNTLVEDQVPDFDEIVRDIDL